VRFKKETDIYYHAYQFEHGYLDAEMKKLKTKIGFLTFKLHRFEQELKDLKTKVSSVVFGTKKLFKAQHTNEKYKDDQCWVHYYQRR
jgi:hypothetical protein